jgi:hypothetical protein
MGAGVFTLSHSTDVGGMPSRVRRRVRAALLAAAVISVAACADLSSGGAIHSRTYVGIVRISAPATRGRVAVSDVKALGIGTDGGPWLGWRASSWITADPRDCQLIVIIRSSAEAAGAAKILQSLEGANPCIVDFTHALSH